MLKRYNTVASAHVVRLVSRRMPRANGFQELPYELPAGFRSLSFSIFKVARLVFYSLRSLFWNANSVRLGFFPSFSEAHFPDSLYCSHHFLFIFTSEFWHKKSNVRPVTLKTLRGWEHTSQDFSKDVMQILHWYCFPKCFLFWVARLFFITNLPDTTQIDSNLSIKGLRVPLLSAPLLRS